MERQTEGDREAGNGGRGGARGEVDPRRVVQGAAREVLIELSSITKQFGATRAVDDVSLTFRPGEIVGLVGENGAGKTTLMRIAAGELRADAGTVQADGRIELVHQHFMLVSDFTIAENLALTWRSRFRLQSRRAIEREAERVIAETGIALTNVARRTGDLSVGEKAKLELIKAIAKHPSMLILDEPTSVLTPHESSELFAVMRRLASSGTSIVFISHKVPEVLEVAQRTIVMRAGKVVADSERMSAVELAEQMVVKERRLPAGRSAGFQPALTLANVSANVLRNINLTINKHEIVALVGVAGNGQSELASILRGLTRPTTGTITLHAKSTAHIPEDRTRDGLVAEMSIAENLALASSRWNPRAATASAREAIQTFSIKANSPNQRAGDLSGGNQQKVILARELSRHPELIVAAEPTRGLDLDATRFVHERLRDAATHGAGILLITSDLDEAFALADAVHVIYRGALSDRMTPAEASTRVGALMAGVA